MKIDAKDLRKLDASIISDVVALIVKAEKIDGGEAYGNGYVQSAVIAELFARLYNDPDSGVILSVDTMKIVYKRKDKP